MGKQASKPGGRSGEQPESECHALLVTTLGKAPAERMNVKPCAAMPGVSESGKSYSQKHLESMCSAPRKRDDFVLEAMTGLEGGVSVQLGELISF